MNYTLITTFIFFLIYRIYALVKLINRRPNFYSDEVAHNTILSLATNRKLLNETFFFTDSINYPTFYHKLINRTFKSVSFYKARLFSVLISLLFIVVNSLFFYFLVGIESNTLLLVNIYFVASLSFFGFLGITFYSFTERPFADLILYCFFLSVYATEILDINLHYVLIVLMTLILFSSKFGLQLILLFSIFNSLIYQHLDYVLLLIISIIISFIINKNRSINILTGHYYHLKWYFKNYGWLNQKITTGGSFSLKNIYRKLSSHTLFSKLFLHMPFYPFYIYFLIDIWDDGGKLFSPLFFLSFLTVFWKFKSIGPSYRYSYLAVPIVMLIYINQNHKDFFLIYFLILIEGLISIVFFQAKYLRNNYGKNDLSYEIDELINNIDLNNRKILTSPERIALSINSYKVFSNTKFYSFLTLNKRLLDLHNKYLDDFPFLTTKEDKLLTLINELSINTFIIDKELVMSKYGTIDVYKKILVFERVLFENERLIVIEINSNF